LHAEGAVRPLLLALLPTLSPHAAPSIPGIRSQIVALKRLRRSPSEFRKWTPDPFYYLFALVAAFWTPWVTRASWLSLRGLATMALSFAFLCLLPGAVSRFRFWFFFRYPNKLLERKIAHLQSELLRQSDLQPRPEPDQPTP
jgi:hypothetical protein